MLGQAWWRQQKPLFLLVQMNVTWEILIFHLTCDKNRACHLVTATSGYEIPSHLYSLLKPTRTLIAKAIGREKNDLPADRPAAGQVPVTGSLASCWVGRFSASASAILQYSRFRRHRPGVGAATPV